MSLKPTFHPDVTRFWFPDLCELHNEATARADVASIAGAGIAAEDHALNGLPDVCSLVSRDFYAAQAPSGVPVATRNVAEAVAGGGVSGVAPGGR